MHAILKCHVSFPTAPKAITQPCKDLILALLNKNPAKRPTMAEMRQFDWLRVSYPLSRIYREDKLFELAAAAKAQEEAEETKEVEPVHKPKFGTLLQPPKPKLPKISSHKLLKPLHASFSQRSSRPPSPRAEELPAKGKDKDKRDVPHVDLKASKPRFPLGKSLQPPLTPQPPAPH